MSKFIKAIQNFKWGYLAFAITFVAVGLCLVFFRETLSIVRILIGVIAAIFGVFFVIDVLSKKARGFNFWYKMILGVLALICGIAFACSEESFTYLQAVAGVYFLLDGAFKMQTGVNSKRYHSFLWWFVFILSIIVIAFGYFLLSMKLNPFVDKLNDLSFLSVFMGVGFCVDGIANLFSIYFLSFIEKKNKQEIIQELEVEGRLPAIQPVEAQSRPSLTSGSSVKSIDDGTDSDN